MNVLIAFVIFLILFLCLIEFFTIILRLTGVETRKAKFQVVSLLTSTGYTTKESEVIVQHPIRRKIAHWIMIFGYVSTVTFVSFLVNILMNHLGSLGIIFGSMILVLMLLRSTRHIDQIEEKIENIIRKNNRWTKFNKVSNQIVFRNKGYGIVEIYLHEKVFLVGKSLLEANLPEWEIKILSIDKGDILIHYPKPSYVFEDQDRVIVYGNLENIQKVFGEYH